MQVLAEPELGLAACLIAPGEGPLTLRYALEPAPEGHACLLSEEELVPQRVEWL